MRKNKEAPEEPVLEIEDLKIRLEEALETLRAIRRGEVDGLLVSGPEGEQVYTLEGANRSYRVFVESINEGAVTLALDGTILYCNDRFAEMVEIPHEQIAGDSIRRFIESSDAFESAFEKGKSGRSQTETSLKRKRGRTLPALMSFNPLMENHTPGVCMVVTDLSGQKQAEARLLETYTELKRENEKRRRSEEALKLEEARLEALLQLSHIEKTAISGIPGFILEQGIRLTQSKIGFIGFLSKDESIYTLHGVSKNVMKECGVHGDPLQWHINGAGIWADAVRMRKTLIINDYDKPHPHKKGLPPGHPAVRNFMVVPLFEGKKIVAVAGVGNKASNYDKSDERQISLLLSGMWNQVQKERAKEALMEANLSLELKVRQRTEELEKINAALRESEARLRALVDNLPFEFWAMDLNGRYTVTNPACNAAWGVREGKTPEEVASTQEILRQWQRNNQRALAGEVVTGEVNYRRDDETRTFYNILAPVKIEDEVRGILGVNIDVTERKRAEELLKRHQRELQKLADNAPDLIYRVDRRMRHVFVNQRVLDITGMRREDYLGLTNRELGHPPELCDLWEETYQRAFDTKEPQEIEFIFASPEGPRNLHMRVMPEFTEDGSIYTVMGVTRDVTEHKQAEKRRQREYSETELANRVLHVFIEYEGDELFAKALSIVQEVMASRHGVFGYIAEPGHLICPSLSKMLDICEIDGKCIHYPPEKWKGLWAKALKEKHSLYSNKTSPVPNGHPIIYNNLATPILFQDEAIGLLNLANKEGGYTEQDKETLETIAARVAPVLYAWIQRKFREDERKQAEETLRESENRLRMALDAAYLISFEWDIQKNEVHRSMSREPALEKTSGDKPGTFEDVLDSVHPDDRELFRNNIKTALTREDGKYENEFRLVRPGGEIAWLYERGRMERDEDGRPVRLVGLSQDITTRKQMESKLRELNETLEQRVAERTAELATSNQSLAEYTAKLEKLNEELQEFAFVASHDLQEPLRKIQTFSDMTMKKCAAQLDGTGLDYLGRINKSTGRMRQLLHDLLQYSRVTTTKEPTKIIGLGEIIHEAAGLFEEQIRDLGGAIQIETNSMPNIEADETQILRVFQNVIGNALKYRGNEPPQVRIYARPAGKKACDIFIEDNGIGFEQQYAERIFRPFQRLHARQEYEGTGMGLAICRKIIERQGGSIRAESEPGKGSTFIIRLPVKQKGKIQPDDKPGL